MSIVSIPSVRGSNRLARPLSIPGSHVGAYLNGKSGLLQTANRNGQDACRCAWTDDRGNHRQASADSAAADAPLDHAARALASDTVESLSAAVAGLGLKWTVQLRTSDTSASIRRKQKDRLPTVLVTTPESLSLLLSYPGAQIRFGSVRCVVIDEWHELMGTKCGVQVELALADVRDQRRSCARRCPPLWQTSRRRWPRPSDRPARAVGGDDLRKTTSRSD